MQNILTDFKKAISRLEEVLALRKTKVNRDSAIKRFELCFDLAWRSVKAEAKNQGMECYSPRQCFKTAFQLGLIEDDQNWLKMIITRNLATHLYSEEFADKIYLGLPAYLRLFSGLLKKLEG